MNGAHPSEPDLEPGTPLADAFEARRARNARALGAFGAGVMPGADVLTRTVRAGSGPIIHTVGYERRSADELVETLTACGVRMLADVRDNPFSRRAEFRPDPLAERCAIAGLGYQLLRELGGPQEARAALRAGGDLAAYWETYRAHLATQEPRIAELCDLCRASSTALLCYERRPEDCHRSILADIVAERIEARIVAVL